MTNDIYKGKWKQIRGKVREGWSVFTHDDSGRVDGKRDQFIGLLQERFGDLKKKLKPN